MRSFVLGTLAILWSAGAPLAHAQVDFGKLLDSLATLNGPEQTEPPPEPEAQPPRAEEPSASDAEQTSDAGQTSEFDQLEPSLPAARAESASRPTASEEEPQPPLASPSPAPPEPQRPEAAPPATGQVPEQIDMQALLADSPPCTPLQAAPSPRPHHAPMPPAYLTGGPLWETMPHSGLYPVDSLEAYRTPACYRGVWAGFAEERAHRCHTYHRCLHGTCTCFQPPCAPPRRPVAPTAEPAPNEPCATRPIVERRAQTPYAPAYRTR